MAKTAAAKKTLGKASKSVSESGYSNNKAKRRAARLNPNASTVASKQKGVTTSKKKGK